MAFALRANSIGLGRHLCSEPMNEQWPMFERPSGGMERVPKVAGIAILTHARIYICINETVTSALTIINEPVPAKVSTMPDEGIASKCE